MNSAAPITIETEAYESLAATLRQEIEESLLRVVPASPTVLYDPVRYVVEAGGKRIRPLLVALASRVSGPEHNWKASAIAIELLHTFTLVHDDIMDNAETRRGSPTVHIKYGRDAAILSGDVMIALALEALANAPFHHQQLLAEFALGFKRVCEGQALDKEYETRSDITLADYEAMISLKTASIIELAATLGAWSAGGRYLGDLRSFARHTGMAFQILDDLLDLTADHASFGKTIGGDILEGKRTFLFVEAMGRYHTLGADARGLMDRIAGHEASIADVARARTLFEELGVLQSTRNRIADETLKAQSALLALPTSLEREQLMHFSRYLLSRAV